MTTITLRVSDAPAREYREVRSLATDGSMVVEIAMQGGRGQSRRSVYRKITT